MDKIIFFQRLLPFLELPPNARLLPKKQSISSSRTLLEDWGTEKIRLYCRSKFSLYFVKITMLRILMTNFNLVPEVR